MSSRDLSVLITDHPFLARPVFIIASGRSGSTLLRSLMDGHPELIVWPFEFSYYSHWEREVGNGLERRPGGELVARFEPLELRNFDEYSADLGGRIYRFDAERVHRFRSVLEGWSDTPLNRREFLQVLVSAYFVAFGENQRPLAWVLTINQPSDCLIEDFPDARILAAIRHPIHTYISAKRYYFKAADLTGVDRCAVYRPRAANSAFRLGLLETAVAPIVHTYDWMRRWHGQVRVHHVRLESVQTDTEAALRQAAAFLGIGFDPILTRATLLGQPHGSNMSSGEDSRGRVVAANWAQSQQYLADLTSSEARWVTRLLTADCEFAGYDVPVVPRPAPLSFWKPLRNEFPSRGGRERAGKRLLRWSAAIGAYVINRAVMLIYGRRHVHSRWPYAK